MAQYANLENGVAPIWVATGDGDFTPSGTCIGFYVSVGGNVSFTTPGGAITVAFTDTQFVSAQTLSFQATGTTATGIYALYI